MARTISGTNIDRPVFQDRQGGQSYDELRQLYQNSPEGRAAGQTFVDPDSLAGWAIAKGYNPNFITPERAQQYITPGSPVFTGLLKPEEIKNFENFISGSSAVTTGQAVFGVPEMERFRLTSGGTDRQFVSPANTPVADAVRNELALGSTPDRIRRSLLTAGYSAADIETALGGQAPQTPQAPNIKFSTGNPQLDDFLNNTWLPLVQAEFSGDPTSILNDDIFRKVEERVNATYGPIFQNELNLIEGGFGRSFRELEAQQAQGIQEAETGRTRTLEDVGVQKERIARSYTEALEDSRAALASRGLAFGGTREKVESGLEQQRQTQIGDVERAGQRTLEDITTQAQNLGLQTPLEQQLATGQFAGSLGRRLEDITAGRTQSQAELAGERVLQIEAEKSRLRALGGQLLASPQFIPTT